MNPNNKTGISDNFFHLVVIVAAILSCAVLAFTDLQRGGDGATITGAFTVISGLAGYSMATKSKGQEINPQ